ncbi:MAG: hypothetical protein LUF90_09190 [Rikenellaceae bacterium]|nr:hypothetical protein [Rikenellaceae bacterium]
MAQNGYTPIRLVTKATLSNQADYPASTIDWNILYYQLLPSGPAIDYTYNKPITTEFSAGSAQIYSYDLVDENSEPIIDDLTIRRARVCFSGLTDKLDPATKFKIKITVGIIDYTGLDKQVAFITEETDAITTDKYYEVEFMETPRYNTYTIKTEITVLK